MNTKETNMPRPDYKNAPRNPAPRVMQDDDKDTVDAENEKWNPTQAVFDGFLVRDYQLANQNISILMSARKPMSVKELKDSTLHSSDVIERVLTSKVASGQFTEAKGKYSLAGV